MFENLVKYTSSSCQSDMSVYLCTVVLKDKKSGNSAKELVKLKR